MPFSIANQRGRFTLTIEGAVTIRHAQDLAASLGDALEEGETVTVDTAGLEDIDTSILQLLCSLRKTVAAMFFDNPSPPFLSAVDRCCLRRELFGGREGS